MKKALFVFMAMALLTACQESLEDRASREAREYTEKYCPTPVVNNTRTDSTVFDKSTRTYYTFCSLSGQMDDAEIISKNKREIIKLLAQTIKENTQLKPYKEANFSFGFVVHSTKNPAKVYLKTVVSPKDYN